MSMSKIEPHEEALAKKLIDDEFTFITGRSCAAFALRRCGR